MCVKRTRNNIKIEDTALSRYLEAVSSATSCTFQQEEANNELEAANVAFKWASQKHADITVLRDKAPRHIRQQLKASHARKRIAVQMVEHTSARLRRKMIAVANLESVYKKAKDKTVEAMNKQIACSSKCMRAHMMTM